MSWFREVRERWLQLVTNLLFALCIIALPAYTDTGKNAFYLLALLSLYYLFTNLDQLKQLDKVLKLFFAVILLHFLWTVFTFYINGSPGRGSNFVWSRQIFLIFLPSLYLLFRGVKIPFNVIWLSVLMSVVVAVYVGYQDIQVAGGRAKGGMHPILFGSILMCEGFYLLVVAIFKKTIWFRLVSLIGFALATLVVIWTQSRGVWAAYPFLLFLLAWILLKNYRISIRLLAVAVLLGALVLAWMHPVVKQRVDLTKNNIITYIESSDINHWSRSTSIGTRLEMWKAGWGIFKENPVLGVGLGGYDLAAKEGQERYRVNSSAYWFYHPHNQYISAISTRGFPGLLFLLGILILPVYYVYKKESHSNVVMLESVVIYLICLAYIVLGLSDVPLDGKNTIMFYAVFVALLLTKSHEATNGKRVGVES